ncbi:MAG: hypothetical protein ACE5JH_02645 [Acidobacteriota bacterium]
MIDDERLQELLSKASSLYHNGEYKGAIDAWLEALTVDSSNQRAREGIRMANLLLGDWQPPQPGPGAPSVDEKPADGGEDPSAGGPEEREARLDLGIARVRELLAQRKYADALEGARGLVPIDPESEEVRRLLEEAQQAFDSSPFIEEHLTLARELFGQERLPEAEAQCAKVVALDGTHPGARELLARIRERLDRSPEGAVAGTGGAATERGAGHLAPRESEAVPERPAGEPEAAGPEAAGPEAAGPEATPSEPLAGAETTGESAATQEEVAARAALDAAFEREGLPPGQAPARPPAPGELPRPGEEGSPAPPAPGEPTPAGKPPAQVEPAPVAEPPKAGEASAWEAELAQLNLKVGEREMFKAEGGGPRGPAPADGADADFMSLLDTEIGGFKEAASRAGGKGPPGTGTEPSELPMEEGVEAVPLATRRPEKKAPAPGASPEAPSAAAAPGAATSPAPRSHAARARGVPSPAPRAGSPASRIFAPLGVLLLVGGAAAWWFFFQPRTAGGAGAPGQPGPPPADSSPDVAAVGAEGPIPTPIGGGSRNAAREPQVAGSEPAVAAGSEARAATADAPGAGTLTPAQIKGNSEPQLTPEEIGRRGAAHAGEGRRLLRQEKWREARAECLAALALDPVNFEVKELVDQVQAKIDEERRLQEGFESARKMFRDKDYQNCLWKLYRLPRDRGLGDIDLFIRNAWFNWAVVSMRAGDVGGALEKVREVLQLDPGDADALKIEDVAERYISRTKDRVFYAYADRLRLRQFDQR